MSTRSGSFVALGSLLIVGLAACDSTGTENTAAKAPAAASSAPAVSATETAPATQKPTDKAGEEGKGGSASCPVTTATLLAAIKKEHPDWGKQELTDITCHKDYAISTRRAVDPQGDTEVETFRYTDGAWRTFVGGSDGYCKGVPEDVTKYFRAHGREGCQS
ncbi:hypothetical protein ACQP2Y_08140 [Actinoplanes sp. CA-051413]|uniref:hypothetical protein n=1 Tax=Actinoplanes sp. CA-051413 TaxID=3239899 RepID=UPI003D9679AC